MFIVLLTGEGDGCDYSIDCNKTFDTLKAETWDDARIEVSKICRKYSSPCISKAQILEVNKSEDFDIIGFKKERRKKREEKHNNGIQGISPDS